MNSKKNQWLRQQDPKKLSDIELELLSSFQCNEHFAYISTSAKRLYELAENMGYKVVEVCVRTIDDLRGERIIHRDAKIPYFEDLEPLWLREIRKEQDCQHLLIINVDDADIRAINCLKHNLEERELNKYCLICLMSKSLSTIEKSVAYDLLHCDIVEQ